MKLVPEGELTYGRVKSEGKCLEVIPVIEDASGQPMILPPVIWHVENWTLGFEDWHTLSSPVTIYPQFQVNIPGSNSTFGHRLSFLIRVLEDGKMPAGIPVGHVDAEAVNALIQAVKDARDE
jgi:hypothetical protein